MAINEQKLLKKLYNDDRAEYISHFIQSNQNSTEGYAFINWYFQELKEYPLEVIESIIVDNYGDEGIDAIEFVEDTGSVLIYQSKYKIGKKGFKKSDMLKFINGLRTLFRFFNDENVKITNKKLLDRFDFLKKLMIDGKINGFKFIIITNTDKISPYSMVSLDEYVIERRRLGKCDKIIYDNKKLYANYRKKLHDAKLGDVNILLKSELKYLHEDDTKRISTGIINGKILANVYKKYNELLLQKNVRVYRKNTLVNQEIYETATNKDIANNFLYYNNGVTIVAENATQSGRSLTMKNPQIVNGGQTIRTLNKAMNEGKLIDDVFVLLKVIEIGNNPILSSEISVKSNTQTAIDPEDIFATTEKFLFLDKAFRRKGYFLERRKGEFDFITIDQLEKLIEEMKIDEAEFEDRKISFKNLIQYAGSTIGKKTIEIKREYSNFMKNKSSLNFIFDVSINDLIFLYKFSQILTEYIRENKKHKKNISWGDEYNDLEKKYDKIKDIKAIISNSNLISHGLLYNYYVVKKNYTFKKLYQIISSENGYILLMEFIDMILSFFTEFPKKKNNSWSNILKRPQLYSEIVKWVIKNWISPYNLYNN